MWRFLVSEKICLQLFLSQTGKRRIVSFFLLSRYPLGSHSPFPWQDEPWLPPALPTALSARQAYSVAASQVPAAQLPRTHQRSASQAHCSPLWITLVTSMAPAFHFPLGVLKHLSYLHFDFFIGASWMVCILSVWPTTCLSHHYFSFRIHGFVLISSTHKVLCQLCFTFPSNYHHAIPTTTTQFTSPIPPEPLLYIYLLISLQKIISRNALTTSWTS